MRADTFRMAAAVLLGAVALAACASEGGTGDAAPTDGGSEAGATEGDTNEITIIGLD